MGEFKHTPGPWKYMANTLEGKNVGYDIRLDSDKYKWIGDAKSANIADCSIEEAEANAKLMAISPQLYDAAKKLLKHLEGKIVADQPLLNLLHLVKKIEE